ncbi:MAG: peptide/nickel transport system substrate-binding protein [Solirubrobacterales bacterium]|nr:peptide/nickel transport system substrate-binding protein [Solirubrobacterales bacterium]
MGPRRHRGAACVAALLALAVSSGCGGGANLPAAPSPRTSLTPGGNGLLVYALASAPAALDPLHARGHDALTIVAQLYEPLTESLAAPYGDLRRRRGIATSWSSSPDRTVWSFHLRRDVRFQDGEPLGSQAVLANVARWTSSRPGRRLLPGLIGADAPRPGVARLIFRHGVGGLQRRLADPRLGLVSPAALTPPSGERAKLSQPKGGGSGPFLVARRAGSELDLTRNPSWWGTAAGLGPALDGIHFAIVADPSQRAGLLSDGQAQVAAGLDTATARRLDGDPLLITLKTGQTWLGLERSVRGLGTRPGPLSAAWLTRIGQR